MPRLLPTNQEDLHLHQVGLEILGYPQQSAAPPGVDILAEKEAELKWGNDEYRRTTLEGMDGDGMDVLSSCVAAQT